MISGILLMLDLATRTWDPYVYTILYHAILYDTILYHTVLYHTVIKQTIL